MTKLERINKLAEKEEAAEIRFYAAKEALRVAFNNGDQAAYDAARILEDAAKTRLCRVRDVMWAIEPSLFA